MKDIIEQLEKLAELKAKGILTEDEFQEQKTKVLKQDKAKQPIVVKTPQTSNTNADKKNLIKFLAAIFFAIMVAFLIKSCNSNKSSAKNTSSAPDYTHNKEQIKKSTSEPVIVHYLNKDEKDSLKFYLDKNNHNLDSDDSKYLPHYERINMRDMINLAAKNDLAAKEEYNKKYLLIESDNLVFNSVISQQDIALLDFTYYNAPNITITMRFNKTDDKSGEIFKALATLQSRHISDYSFICSYEGSYAYMQTLTIAMNNCVTQNIIDREITIAKKFFNLMRKLHNKLTVEMIEQSPNVTDKEVSYLISSCQFPSESTNLSSIKKCNNIIDRILNQH